MVAHSFKEVAQMYLDGIDVELSTRNSYRDALNIHWAALGSRDIASITAQELIALDDAKSWPSKKTRKNALTPLRGTFGYALSRGWITANPAAALRAGKVKKPEPDPYTSDEADTLLTWLDGTLAGPYYRVAFGTGMRTGELLSLTWDAYDGEALYVSSARVRGRLKGTKTDKPRRVLLLPDVQSVIEGMPRPIRGGPIFTNQYGRGYQSGYHLNRWFRKAHTATGVRYRESPYPWRHTYASIALSSGVKPILVATQLGHRMDVLLSVYGKYLPRDDDMAELMKMGANREQGGLRGAK